MANKISLSFSLAIRREVRLIHRELVDGCNECKGIYRMCERHNNFLNCICADTKKYIEVTKDTDGRLTTKRLFDLTNIEGGVRAVKLII